MIARRWRAAKHPHGGTPAVGAVVVCLAYGVGDSTLRYVLGPLGALICMWWLIWWGRWRWAYRPAPKARKARP